MFVWGDGDSLDRERVRDILLDEFNLEVQRVVMRYKDQSTTVFSEIADVIESSDNENNIYDIVDFMISIMTKDQLGKLKMLQISIQRLMNKSLFTKQELLDLRKSL